MLRINSFDFSKTFQYVAEPLKIQKNLKSDEKQKELELNPQQTKGSTNFEKIANLKSGNSKHFLFYTLRNFNPKRRYLQNLTEK